VVPLEVTIPMGAPTGAWVVVSVRSKRLTPSGVTPDGEDFSHRTLVGVHVP
jgi:hypothetical protein